jgi:hypothetical protein
MYAGMYVYTRDIHMICVFCMRISVSVSSHNFIESRYWGLSILVVPVLQYLFSVNAEKTVMNGTARQMRSRHDLEIYRPAAHALFIGVEFASF